MTNEQAIELIMSLKWDKNIDEQEDKALSMAIKALSAQPEIIRCKDCYHYPSEYADCPMIGWARNENDFCSKAEGKDDD